MLNIKFSKSRQLALMLATTLVAAPACADKPAWAGSGKGEKHEHKAPNEHAKSKQPDHAGRPATDISSAPATADRYFDDRQRTIVHDYYAEQFRAGRCPPGLAKKHNGCLPPGQAKKWKMGQPLPHDLTYYDLPYSVTRQFGPPPAGHRFVRVANDILLITTGTRMVVDAIMDLGGM